MFFHAAKVDFFIQAAKRQFSCEVSVTDLLTNMNVTSPYVPLCVTCATRNRKQRRLMPNETLDQKTLLMPVFGEASLYVQKLLQTETSHPD